MSKGKAEFLRSLKDAVAQLKKGQAERRVALDYLKRWSAGLGENPDRDDLAWLKTVLDLATVMKPRPPVAINRSASFSLTAT